ncbi:MAG: DUF6110 family protein [Eubacteriales bacterium]
MFDFGKKDNAIIFVAGIVSGLVGLKVGKSKKMRDFVVKTLAKGMMVKDSVVEEYTNIREEADDICEEAKNLAQEKSFVE